MAQCACLQELPSELVQILDREASGFSRRHARNTAYLTNTMRLCFRDGFHQFYGGVVVSLTNMTPAPLACFPVGLVW